ncbi:MAG: DUF1761 domain-containing protein [Candidatus Saccharimonadales bacterium]
MPNVDINIWAVLVAAVVSMVVGSFWYSKSLFGKEWAKLVGRKLEEMGGGGRGYAVAAVGALIQAYILAHFVQYTGATTFWDGIVTGSWLWLGFVAVVIAVNMVFEGRSWALWKINAGYFLVVLLINGGLLAAWR